MNNTNKKRILFFGEAVSLSHIIRPLVLAQSLNKEEYDILFACDSRYQKMIEAAGLKWQSIPTMSSSEFLERLKAGATLYSYERLKEYVAAELKLFSQLFPDH